LKQIKHILSLVVAVAFMAGVGNAQNNAGNMNEKFQVGLKFGANVSNVYDTEGEDFTADYKFGLAGGGFVSLSIGSFLGIQPEILFSQKGYKGAGSFLGSEYTYSRTSNFIDLPLFLTLKPTNYLTFLLGPQFSFLVRETYRFENEFLNINKEEVFENDNIRRNTLCAVGGFDINFDQFVIGARTGWDLQNNNGDGKSTTPRYKNVWYQGTLGYRFFSN
jgi:hypothetical protein